MSSKDRDNTASAPGATRTHDLRFRKTPVNRSAAESLRVDTPASGLSKAQLLDWHAELLERLGPLPYADVPRRSFIDRLSPPEGKIREAMLAVEGLPADPRLTEALNLLDAAWQKVADYVDEQIEASASAETARTA